MCVCIYIPPHRHLLHAQPAPPGDIPVPPPGGAVGPGQAARPAPPRLRPAPPPSPPPPAEGSRGVPARLPARQGGARREEGFGGMSLFSFPFPFVNSGNFGQLAASLRPAGREAPVGRRQTPKSSRPEAAFIPPPSTPSLSPASGPGRLRGAAGAAPCPPRRRAQGAGAGPAGGAGAGALGGRMRQDPGRSSFYRLPKATGSRTSASSFPPSLLPS